MKINIIIVSVAFAAIVLLLIQISSIRQKNFYHRNRMIESEYLKMIVNDSNFSYGFFSEKWGGNLQKLNDIYILTSQTVLKDPFFVKKEYKTGKSDFFGYEFKFDNKGNLKWFNFYKP